jgi:hypothetical protein
VEHGRDDAKEAEEKDLDPQTSEDYVLALTDVILGLGCGQNSTSCRKTGSARWNNE